MKSHPPVVGQLPADCSRRRRVRRPAATLITNYDYAYIRSSLTLVRSYKKNGSGALTVARRPAPLRSPATPRPSQAVAVQRGSAVTPGSAYYTRGTNWNFVGQLKPIDYAMGLVTAGG